MRKRTRYTFIFNPAADKGRAFRKEPWLKSRVSALGDASLVTTEYAGHAGEIALAASHKCDFLVACGGDGTLSEIANAVAGSDVVVGVLPIGSANDFIKTIGYAGTLHEAFQECLAGSSRKVDLGHVVFNRGERRYFVNSLGIGLTGRIARKVKLATWLKGEISYVYALLSVFVGYAPVKMHIKITAPDGVLELHEPVFAFSVSNGKVEGGRFRIAPEADPADGLLDVCILKSIPKRSFPGYVVKYLRGNQIKDPLVLYCKASCVEIMVPDTETMHMDGEVFETLPGSIRISVAPGALTVVS
ncbi:MAG: diacylglycerol kinase family lipid kinase [Chlorobi bacterium]|nr:diacylglycerol kinase family lipid kinase [Chlorobiota bacterium]